MPQTEMVSARQHPKSFYVLAVFLVCLAMVCRAAYDHVLWANADLVKWRSIEDGHKEARKLHKPILYYFTAAWCGPCKKLKAECFSNAKIAEQINAEYVPILVLDRKLEEGKNSKAVEKLQEKLQGDSFPFFFVVPWDCIDAEHGDAFAIDSPTRGLLRESMRVIPCYRGYQGARDFTEYLRLMRLWNKIAPYRGNIDWRPNQTLFEAPGARPKLIFLLTEHQEESNNVRNYLFDAPTAAKYFNENFDNYLVDYSRGGVAKTQALAEELRRKYGLRKLPAFIVLDEANREPAVLTGFSSNESVFDFLERATHGKARAPAQKGED